MSSCGYNPPMVFLDPLAKALLRLDTIQGGKLTRAQLVVGIVASVGLEFLYSQSGVDQWLHAPGEGINSLAKNHWVSLGVSITEVAAATAISFKSSKIDRVRTSVLLQGVVFRALWSFSGKSLKNLRNKVCFVYNNQEYSDLFNKTRRDLKKWRDFIIPMAARGVAVLAIRPYIKNPYVRFSVSGVFSHLISGLAISHLQGSDD